MVGSLFVRVVVVMLEGFAKLTGCEIGRVVVRWLLSNTTPIGVLESRWFNMVVVKNPTSLLRRAWLWGLRFHLGARFRLQLATLCRCAVFQWALMFIVLKCFLELVLVWCAQPVGLPR